jgi:hypothetical protein
MLNIPVYMRDKYSNVPNSIKFDFNYYKSKYRNHMTSTISYMLAMAIDSEKYKEIMLCGISVGCCTEYMQQQQGLAYWVGYAEAKGITVNIVRPSNLLEDNMYQIDKDKNIVCPYLNTQVNIDISYENFRNDIGVYTLRVEKRDTKVTIQKLTQMLNNSDNEKTKAMLKHFIYSLINGVGKIEDDKIEIVYKPSKSYDGGM